MRKVSTGIRYLFVDLSNNKLFFLKLREPFLLFANFREALVSFFAYRFVKRGLLNLTPSEQIAKSLMPTSTPTVLLTIGSSFITSFTNIETKYLPDLVLDTVS